MKVVIVGTYSVEEVLGQVHESSSEKKTEFHGHNIRFGSTRFRVFNRSLVCECCGIIGKKFILKVRENIQNKFGQTLIVKEPELNLFAEEYGEDILMTQDHIIPQSKGGSDNLDNLQTMCSICNNIKGNSDLDLHELLLLRAHFNIAKERISEFNSLTNLYGLEYKYQTKRLYQD